MIALAIDTCSTICATALVRDNNIIGKFFIDIKNYHDEKLIGMVDSLLQSCTLSIDDIDGYIVSIGPGSFTGIRIGMSVTKGFAIAKEKPIVGISSLDGLAWNFFYNYGNTQKEIVYSIIDAQRDEVFCSKYMFDGRIKRVSDYRCLTLLELKNNIESSVLFIGNGVEKVKTYLGNTNYSYVTGIMNKNDVSSIALLGYDKLLNFDGDDLLNLEPLYIKDFKPIKIRGDL
jgi:tRNA threonylcarbamoyl adenosine modification protein YeaZ